MEQFASFVEHHESNHVLSQPFQSFFVSHFSTNPKPMSKSGQEQNLGESSATAKPKPMSLVQVKARTRSLVCERTALNKPEVPEKALTKMP